MELRGKLGCRSQCKARVKFWVFTKTKNSNEEEIRTAKEFRLISEEILCNALFSPSRISKVILLAIARAVLAVVEAGLVTGEPHHLLVNRPVESINI